MFTGIVEEIGEVLDVRENADVVEFTVRGGTVSSDARHGDSIAVNGVCLTVIDPDGGAGGTFRVELVPETLKRSSLSAVVPGTRVNLERAVPVGGRLGGHIVQGHVDGVATVLSRTPGERTDEVRFSLAPELARYVVEKGSITVDGVSLTVAGVSSDTFSVALIPTTLSDTTLGFREPGDTVNLEVDVVAKYVERLTAGYRGATSAREEAVER
ncbi:riboflavin synthase [Pseudonocardia sichuanensis]|uniref:Riboflavin synthase n=1 Tax=Pseudonocardia kunmingensis TaxID=630975 RepID=A0A543D3Y6_9PSEU|nr:riboflavin synthase [Pseudonocardia kunmingensis]TQM04051.1 riboflavin synthase alpha chain [Pseudonocardia kunmingensis]